MTPDPWLLIIMIKVQLNKDTDQVKTKCSPKMKIFMILGIALFCFGIDTENFSSRMGLTPCIEVRYRVLNS